MSEFNEFDEQGSVPAKETGSIISHAFEMYKGVFLYVFLYMIIYIIGDSIIQSLTGFTVWQDFDYENFGEFSSNSPIWQRPESRVYYSFSGLWSILLAPLTVGLIYITNKFNTKIPIQFSDLFIGYRQNLGNILLYGLITFIIYLVSLSLCGLPFLFVYPLFLMGYPILLFENATAMDALNKTFNIAKENYAVFLLTALLGGIISLSGILLCCVGIIFSLPFINIVMYSTYCAFLGKPRQIINR
ncbi:beta-carotene 15,15'-monooxygenase [Chryseobacterium echinoideorum]|uniref:beta-carotene 15,15'-monooxygenase n=1 Tax=Chryseobacterium echinoideorum TaxID=1549648 RepID=UPI0011856578|nr:beta-carotene 15,15'-monooxygenase [Chryseobacterium echinoideorum]